MISLGITFNASQVHAAIARLRGPEMTRIITRAVERRGNEARREAVRSFVSGGVGKGIFGRNDRGAWKIITLSKAQVRGESVVAELKASGFAALQDQGGSTKPHPIRAGQTKQSHYRALSRKFTGRAISARKRVLAIPIAGGFGFGGEMIFREKVNHPGSRIPKRPFMEAVAEKARRLAQQDILRDVEAAWYGRAA